MEKARSEKKKMYMFSPRLIIISVDFKYIDKEIDFFFKYKERDHRLFRKAH